jgi:hypothetical protein
MRNGRRRFIMASGALISAMTGVARAQAKPTIDVRKLGAFGDGKLPDAHIVRQAVRLASERSAGATILFPPGEYFLGAADAETLVNVRGLRNVRFVGERAVLSCRSVEGQSSMLYLAGCRNIAFDGLTFRDYGANRNIDWLGASAINLASDGSGAGTEDVEIRNCSFQSVLTAVLSSRGSDQARCRGVTLNNLTVTKSYYGLNFQNNCDSVTGRNLRFDDVKRSYFPYGVSNHDIELEALNNATGYTDVLIKCYRYDTRDIRVRLRCRGKRGGDAIVGIDQQHEKGRGIISRVAIDLDVADVDCKLDALVMMRSFDARGRFERQTDNRWDDITLDGTVKVCDGTKLIHVSSVGRTAGRMLIGPRLAAHPRLPSSIPGFVVTRT